ncbi:hypothetical protein RFM23_28345 [Mesorhizobium abyssinicae]|uniref:Collagen-like protein n=1 Tax=Mesorhizobium abyssinicae TaxID=1209958 RepID=A0ABU5AW55_9HYPH|nr:hypothetical protein [Mesorhizobium abyssinicae]MDX8541540.1 hypothetical protein [Mesorhizobium abyssinicae]
MAGKSKMTNSSPPSGNFGPAGFFAWAAKIAPQQTVFVAGGVLVFAGAALVLGWTRGFSLGTVLGIAVAIIVLGLVVGALSSLSAASKRLEGVGSFLAWALALLFVTTLVLMVSSVFFGVPPAGAVLMSRLLATTEPLTRIPSAAPSVVIKTGETATLGDLGSQLTEEPAQRDVFKRIQEIAKRPELDIDGTLKIGAGQRVYIVASTLRLSAGEIVTNGADVTIEVNNFISDRGALKSFSNPETQPQAAVGSSGGKVTLIVHGSMTGRLVGDLRGQNGADGAAGRAGGKGPKGARGDNAASGMFDCSHGAGRGGTGGQGEAGGDGANGFAGGAGGTLIVQAADTDAAKAVIGEVPVRGGAGGAGGAGGPGGPGGDGGDGGSPVGLCQGGGPTGAQGPKGPDGKAGHPGAMGADGQVRFTPPPSV